MEFINGVLDGTIALTEFHPRALRYEYDYWAVRYDEPYTPQEGEKIQRVLALLEAAMSSPASRLHG